MIRGLGRDIAAGAYNAIEPNEREALPGRCEFDDVEFSRRRQKTPVRGGVATLFGSISLERFAYEPLSEARDQGHTSISPLEMQLGIVAGNATPALAERVGRLAASHTESEVLEVLKSEHAVSFSKETLRKVTRAVGEGLADHLHEAQKQQLLSWLREARDSKGRYQPVLAVGRDGIMLPIRGESTDREGCTGTISVPDRRGHRLGTVYLGQMPEEQQVTLSQSLTRLITDVLSAWDGPPPRLAYITDAGHHPTNYYWAVLQAMGDPRRPGRALRWTRVVDFYHASSYVAKLAELLFEDDGPSRHAWLRRMNHLLKHDTQGVSRVLRSAAWLRSQRTLTKKQTTAYESARGYLRNHRAAMHYAQYRQLRIPIGSGVTEAACKTVFTQRFKESGMSWKLTPKHSIQPILVLRLTQLSGVWDATFRSWLRSRPLPAQNN